MSKIKDAYDTYKDLRKLHEEVIEESPLVIKNSSVPDHVASMVADYLRKHSDDESIKAVVASIKKKAERKNKNSLIIEETMSSHMKTTDKDETDLHEAVKLGSKVRIHAPGKEYHDKVGHGTYKGAPKIYTVDYDGGKSVQLDKKNLKMHKEEVELDEAVVYQVKDKRGEVHHTTSNAQSAKHYHQELNKSKPDMEFKLYKNGKLVEQFSKAEISDTKQRLTYKQFIEKIDESNYSEYKKEEIVSDEEEDKRVDYKTDRRGRSKYPLQMKKSSEKSLSKTSDNPSIEETYESCNDGKEVNELSKNTLKSYLDKVRFKQAKNAVQANMGTPGMKKKASSDLEKTHKSMELAKSKLVKEYNADDNFGANTNKE